MRRQSYNVNATTEKKDVYQEITDLVLKKIDEGVLPWNSCFLGNAPVNAVSKTEYRGVNKLLLTALGEEHTSRHWLTYKQAQELGGHVKKGEKGVPVVFWKIWTPKDDAAADDKEAKTIPLLKKYTVFNADQCEGLDLPELTNEAADPIDAAERIWTEMHNRPTIRFNGDHPYYTPTTDTVTVPPRQAYSSQEEWYSTLFHELGHSTGHKTRLNRELACGFGSEKYGREELIAELTAAFLCAACGIEKTTLDNSAAYIDGWRKAIQGDRKMVILAAAAAQKAADYIRNISH